MTKPLFLSLSLVALVLAALILIQGEVSSGQPLYRWVDDKGEVHYTDQLPPEHADKSRMRLSEQGLAVEVKPAAPSPEERERAKEEERRRAEEERRKAERLAEDRRLVQSYRTVEELELARNGQIAIIDAIIQSKRDQVRTLSLSLLKLDRERQSLQAANKPSEEIDRQIAAQLDRLRTLYGEILEEEQRKLAVWDEFAGKLARYRELKRLPPAESSAPISDELPLLSCREASRCHAQWKRALVYMRAPLTGGESLQEFSAPGLSILLHRTKEEERLLHLVWIQRSPDQPVWIYLDLQCRNRQTGSLNCLDPQVAALRPGFRAAVELALQE